MQKARQDERTEEARGQAYGDNHQSFSDGNLQNIPALRAHGDADANFIGPAAKRIGHHSVNANRSEQQRHSGKDSQKLKRKSALRQIVLHHRVHGAHAKYGNAWIQRLDFLAYGVAQG